MERMIKNPDEPFDDVVVYPTHIVTRQSTDIYATNDRHISSVLQYIHRNIDDKLTIAKLTRLVPLSRRLLEKRFKQILGLPVYTYIINLRIENFAVRLLESSATVIEIADETGFSDYKNLARNFKKVKGCTPTKYRLRHSLKH